MADGWQDRFWASAEGLRLHARDYAPRPVSGADAGPGGAPLPVVCVHGLTRNARDFEALAPRITAAGRRVLAVDVRGRGGSARDPAADYRLPAYVEDVVRMADALGIARAIFVGTSMGGLVTIALANRAPELVAGAVINDIGPEIAGAGLARIAAYVGNAPVFADWDAAAAHMHAQNGHALPRYTAADWLAMARRMFRDEGGRIVADYDPAIARPFAGEPVAIDAWPYWSKLVKGRPVLLLRGALSDLLDRAAAERMVAGAPAARLVTVAGVGHAPMLDEPEAAAAIDAFLQSLP